LQRRGLLQIDDNNAWPDLFVVRDFLESPLRERIIAEMSAAQARSSLVYGSAATGVVNETMRRSLRLTAATETAGLITSRLLGYMDRAGEHFGVTLSECEESQFLCYKEGDFFVAHQDGNTGMLRLDTERRRVSTVIFLSRETDAPEPGPNVHCGGSLIFTDPWGSHEKFHLRADPGTLIAFRSETTHEVTPVTYGERYSIVSWYC
jgi:SM-20-related protein